MEPSFSETLLPVHPRPLLERGGWVSLNGTWEFAFDAESRWRQPEEVVWGHCIEVPFAPETKASGIGRTDFFRACWYRRTFDAPLLQPGERLILHFCAVDYSAEVWLNGHRVVQHEGGYTPFKADVTTHLLHEGPQVLVVHCEDDPADLAKPRGKQDWQLRPHSIWYPRTTGIWQTVWYEVVPASAITHVRWTPSIERWELSLEVRVDGPVRNGLQLWVRLHTGNTILANDRYTVLNGEVIRRIALSDPGIDDYRNELLWSPAAPTLIHADLQLLTESGRLVDKIYSYTALRSIGVQGDRFVLNGRPYHLRMILDQGYWARSGMTAPDDSALRADVLLAKAMGFNGVRKHQKIESPVYLYWADVLGLLVWEEMPSAYRFTKRSIKRLTREWTEAIERDISHPCIVAWVPFNESWGVPDLPDSPAQRHYVQALYHLTKTLDPTRPVVGNDGWESVATDIIGIHDYDEHPERIAMRYGSDEMLPRLFKRERPGGRVLMLGGPPPVDQPIMLTEFGGIACGGDRELTWGYRRARSRDELAEQYAALLASINSLSILAGFCYTQFTDTYQEANGLLDIQRQPKFPLEQIRAATRGVENRNEAIQPEWRERIMDSQRSRYAIPPEDYRTDNVR